MSSSSKGSLSTRIARRLITTESTYHHVRRAQLLAMYVSRRAHEQDFKYFRRLNGQEGLFIDVGANSGQSAISFALFNSTYRIHSFEPYTQLEPSLRFAKRLLGKRYTYSMFGLSDQEAIATLYVPKLGDLPLLARASTHESVVSELIAHIQPQYHRRLTVAEIQIQLRPFDSLNLAPQIIKIDVEGAEPRVLQGMRETLIQHRPLLLIERSSSYDECHAILSQAGYSAMVYDPESDVMSELADAPRSTNFFALPQ
jgi:FkbM family methyltransferase